MRHLIIAANLSLVVVFFASCASKSPDCTPEKVRAAGLNLALAGKSMDDGNYACGGGLKADYEAGYKEGKRKFCAVPTAELKGFTDGDIGKEKLVSEEDFPICDNKQALVEAYQKHYAKGLDHYCSNEKGSEMGNSIGERGLVSDFSPAAFSVCGADRLSAFQAAFDKGYKSGLTQFCSASRIEADAFKDGAEGNPKADVPTKYKLCGEDRKGEIAANYSSAYNKGLTEFCGPTGIQKVAMRQAQDGDSPEFPAKLSVCLDMNPTVKTQYPITFQLERKKYVEARCKFQEGILIGKKDGEATNQKRNEMPAFCSADAFPDYFEGYLQGWREAKDKICDVTRAYNRGVSDARARKDMAYNVPMQCPPEYQAILYQKYRNGYTYAKNLPQTVSHEEEREVTEENYSASKARDACKKAGFSSSECSGVTSIACIEKGNKPFRCKIAGDYIRAVDTCFGKGFSPQQCQNVKDAECIEAGKNPFQCGNPPSVD